MSKPSPGLQDEPLRIGCRMQILLLMAFVVLFLAACWLVGTMVATSP